MRMTLRLSSAVGSHRLPSADVCGCRLTSVRQRLPADVSTSAAVG